MVLMQQYDYIDKHVEDTQVAYQTPLISQEQYDCLNRLVGAAAFDETIQSRLFNRDESLRTLYRLSDITWNHLMATDADTIEKLSCYLSSLRDKVLNH